MRPHWWCVYEDVIYDPTDEQFDELGGILEYLPFDEIPVGRCANCGDYSFASQGGNDTICSPACHASYVAYLERDLRSYSYD